VPDRLGLVVYLKGGPEVLDLGECLGGFVQQNELVLVSLLVLTIRHAFSSWPALLGCGCGPGPFLAIAYDPNAW